MLILRYDTERFDFRGCASGGLGLDELGRLHELPVPVADWPRRRREQWWLSRLYATVGETMHALYLQFLDEVVREQLGAAGFWTQPRVCFRVQLPATEPVPLNFHRDGDWGQSDDTLNLWIPYVSVRDTNALWVETLPGREDHRAINLDYGEALIFAGAPLSHGSVANRTGVTRLSGDLRFRPRKVAA